MWSIILCFCGLVAFLVYFNGKRARMVDLAEKIPGPPCWPIIQNAFTFGFTTTDFPIHVQRLLKIHGGTMKFWIAFQLYVVLLKPADLEIVLTSNSNITKARDYDFLKPWVGTGLLTSTGAKWRKRRKILTPAFHFNILEQFIGVFNTNGEILVEMLKKHENGSTFDVYSYITLYTLDNICETAMGVSMNAQKNYTSDYVNAVRNVSEIVMQRSANKPWLRPDFLFHLLPEGRLHDKSLKIMHKVTTDVIKTRKAEIAARKDSKECPELENTSFYSKKRLAFLDLLIEAQASDDGIELSDEDIREEVDTFMFEGHDTTSSAISFTLYFLSRNQHIQDKLVAELNEIYSDRNEVTTHRHLQEMKYTERVIKETLRLYPSVPIFGREVSEDITLSDGLVIPAGATILMLVGGTHRSFLYDDPETFDPDRFLPENCQQRSPFDYLPFSAGPRNCIGQKFAMLEIKSSLSHVLRHYKVLAAPPEEDILVTAELVLRSTTGIRLKIVPRV